MEEARTILLGASNSWFPARHVCTVDSTRERLTRWRCLIGENWNALKDIPTLDVARYVTAPSRMPSMVEFTAEDIWASIEARRQASGCRHFVDDNDLKVAEWERLTRDPVPTSSRDFLVQRAPAPSGFERYFEETVLLERLREVRALLAFTRIESKGDFADAGYVDDGRETPLSRESPTWLPASEVRGEGLFLRLQESMLQDWESRKDVRVLEQEFLAAHKAWRRLRKQTPVEAGFPGIRFVLLHSLSHALMRQIALECGYTSPVCGSACTAGRPQTRTVPWLASLIYTAASDSEGTLGGLVRLGQPITLGRQIQHALKSMHICGSESMCSEHTPTEEGRTVHGACCHACLFAPETSCERGNRFLDRSTLAATFAARAVEIFSSG